MSQCRPYVERVCTDDISVARSHLEAARGRRINVMIRDVGHKEPDERSRTVLAPWAIHGLEELLLDPAKPQSWQGWSLPHVMGTQTIAALPPQKWPPIFFPCQPCAPCLALQQGSLERVSPAEPQGKMQTLH
jgi:hypothetical protein